MMYADGGNHLLLRWYDPRNRPVEESRVLLNEIDAIIIDVSEGAVRVGKGKRNVVPIRPVGLRKKIASNWDWRKNQASIAAVSIARFTVSSGANGLPC
jgi:hypothetical protein